MFRVFMLRVFMIRHFSALWAVFLFLGLVLLHYPRLSDAEVSVRRLYRLGNAYYKSGDYAEAASFYRQAANRGDKSSQYNLANLYYKGLGVERDYDQAILLFRDASERGHSSAQYNLSLLYARGEVVDVNIPLAYCLLILSFSAGNESAREALVLLQERLTTDERELGKRLLRDWRARISSHNRSAQ